MDVCGLRFKFVQRQQVGRGFYFFLNNFQRQQTNDGRLLDHHRLELGVYNVDFVHAALFKVGGEIGQQSLAEFACSFKFRRVGSTGPHLGVIAAAEVKVRLCLAADQVGRDVFAFSVQQFDKVLCLLQDAGGVGTGKTTVGSHDQHCSPADGIRLGCQWVVDLGLGRNGRNGTGDRIGVWQ